MGGLRGDMKGSKNCNYIWGKGGLRPLRGLKEGVMYGTSKWANLSMHPTCAEIPQIALHAARLGLESTWADIRRTYH